MSRDARTAALLALATLAACIAVNLPFLLTYAVRGDTAALMLHSTRFFPADAGGWLSQGFDRYFINYPEATRPYTAFVRPMVNATIWLESLLAPGENSPVFLLTNYLGHAACTGMVYLAARRIGGVCPRRSLLAAVLFGGTLAAVELLRSPAFRADMLAAGFGLAALLAVDGWRRGTAPHPPAPSPELPGEGGNGRGWFLEGAVLLLLLALLSKETAVAAPIVAAGWAMIAPGERPRGRRVGAAAVLLLPLAVFFFLRATGPQGAYVSLAGVRGNVAEVASSAFFPGGGVFELLTVVRGREPSALGAARMLLAFALNVVGALLVLSALLRRDRQAALLVAMGAAALAIPALVAPVPRMLYFGQMFTLPLFAMLLPPRALTLPLRGGPSPKLRERDFGSLRSRVAVRAITVVALLVGPAWLLGSALAAQRDEVARNRDSRELQRVLAAELRDHRVHRVYLVSDMVGDYGSLALLQAAALGAGRTDVAARVVASMGRFGDAPRRGTLELRRRGSELVMVEQCGSGCDFSFPGLVAGAEAKLGVPGVIDYRAVQPRRLEVAIPWAACDALLVGFTPAAPGVHVLRPCDTAWRRVAADEGGA